MEASKTNKSAQAAAMVTNLRDRFNKQQSQSEEKYTAIASLLEQVQKQVESQRRQNEDLMS